MRGNVKYGVKKPVSAVQSCRMACDVIPDQSSYIPIMPVLRSDYDCFNV